MGGAAEAPLKKMSLTPEWRPAPPPQLDWEEERKRRNAKTRALLASYVAHDLQLEEYSKDLDWWREKHRRAVEELVNVNRAAVQALSREDDLVTETRTRLYWEIQRLRTRLDAMEAFSDLEEKEDELAEAELVPLHAPPRHQRDLDLVNASSKVRRANRLALEAISRDATGVLSTLLSPERPSRRHRRSTNSPSLPFHPPRSLILGHTADIKAEQLTFMTSAVREAVMAGRVYAVQTRSIGGGKEKVRSGRIIMDRGNLHLHCLVEKPPPPGSVTVEHREILHELIDRECTLAFLDVEDKSTALRGRVYIRLAPDTGRARQFTWLCTGQRGVSYTDSAILGVLDKGGTRERLVGGDYEGRRGAGGASLIPWLGWGREYRREWEAGVVRGWWGGMHRAAQFFITTQKGFPGETVHFAFGQVEYGLEVVREVAKLPNPSEAKVVDCGVVVVEEMERAAAGGYQQDKM